MSLLNRFQLQNKLLLLGIIPAAALAVILATYLTSTRLTDMYDLLHKTNENLANSIAESSVNGVFSGDLDALNHVISASINEPDVISINITSKQGITLSYATSKIATPTLISEPSKKITQAIQLQPISRVDEFDVFDSLLVGPSIKTDETIGYVTLTLSYSAIEQRQLDILLNTTYITLLLLFIIGLIARFISATIARPILQLTTDVNNISHGNYISPRNKSTRSNKDEIATLETGVHKMAYQIKEHQQIQEKKIQEATQKLRLQNNKLFSAQAEIVKSAEAKSRFISHISHEIRTPLNGIIGFLEIIQRTKLDNEQVKLINASHLSSKNLHTIINEVLDFAQLEAGKIIINKVDFQLKKTIQDTLLLLSTQAEHNGVTLEYQHDDMAPDFINQDCVKFGQILTNLIGNAIKFSQYSTVTIALKFDPAKNEQFEISVSDQGIGISEENIQQLFKEYSQLDNLTREQGTGLGLVITKQIIDALHGTIDVSSTLGQGSTFSFSLPFTNVKDSYSLISQPVSRNAFAPDLTEKNILVADDNEINRMLLSNLLERQHANVTCVNNGQQALDIANREAFDLMLLDLRMPMKMGNEVLFEIRNKPTSPNYKTPAVAITAHITSGEEKAHHISSFDGYLIKPIDQVQFFKLIEQLLNEHDSETLPFVSSQHKTGSGLSNKPFDYEIAKTSMNADPAFMLMMLQKFFSELAKQNASVSKLIKQRNYKEAAEAVHRVHGSAAYCGTPLLKLSSKQFEISLRKADMENIPLAHKQFCSDIETLLQLADTIVSSLKKPLENKGA